MLTTGLLAGGMAAFNYAAIRYNLGGAAFRSYHTASEYLAAGAKVVAEAYNSRFKYMQVTKTITDDKRTVFKFDKVSIVDFDQIDKEIKEGLAKLDENGDPTAADQADKSAPAPTEAELLKGKYTVELEVIDPEHTTLGEIDYCSWRDEKKFKVIIRRAKTGEEISPEDEDYKEEYDAILETLRRFAKSTIGETYNAMTPVSQVPENTVWNVVAQSLQTAKKTIGTILDKVGLDFAGLKDTEVNEVTQRVNLLGGLNPHIVTEEYMRSVQELALRKIAEGGGSEESKKEAKTISSNYFDAIAQAKRNELVEAVRTRKQLKSRIVASELSKHSTKFKIFIGVTIVLTILLVAGLIALAVFNPAIGVPLLLTVGASFKSVFVFAFSKIFNIPGGILTFGAIFTAATIYKKTSKEWANESTATLKGDLRKVEKQEKELEADLQNIEQMKKASEKTLDAIAEFSKSKSATLDLNCERSKDSILSKFVKGTLGKISQRFQHIGENRIGNAGVNTICLHLLDTIEIKKQESPCTTINLANNDITDEGANSLAGLIAKGQTTGLLNLQKLDLTGNDIGVAGLTSLQQALQGNFTITDFKYSTEFALTVEPKKIIAAAIEEAKNKKEKNPKLPEEATLVSDAQAVTKDLDRQVLINRQLKGIEPGLTEVSELFESREKFNHAVLKKVKSNFGITTSIPGYNPEKQTPEIREGIANVIKQNLLFEKLCGADPTYKDYEAALQIDSSRCADFMKRLESSQATNAAAVVQKIRGAISKELLGLCGADCTDTLHRAFPNYVNNKELESNIKDFAELIKLLPKNDDDSRTSDPMLPKMDKYIQDIFAALNSSSTKFKKSLANSRKAIAADITIKDESLRGKMLAVFDKTLNPDLDTEEKLKLYQLQKMITDLRMSEKNNAEIDVYHEAVFKEFMKLHKEVGEEKFNVALTTSSELKEDAKANIKLLISIAKEMEKTPGLLPVLAKSFGRLGTQPHNQFVEKLQEKRKMVAENINSKKETLTLSYAERDAICTAIDIALDPTLSDSKKLSLHKLQKLITEHPAGKEEETFKAFMDIYKTIDPAEATALFAKVQEDASRGKFLDMVRADVFNKETQEVVFTTLRDKAFSKEHKLALLNFCLYDERDPNYEKKAELVANILSNEEATKLLLDGTDKDIKAFRNDPLKGAFAWPGKLWGEWTGKTYDEMNKALDGLRTTYATTAPIADIKQRRDLLNTLDMLLYPALKGPDSPQFKINQLNRLVVEHPADWKVTMEEFLSIYQSINGDNPQKLAVCFTNMDENMRYNLSALMAKGITSEDINSPLYQLLRNTDEPHRIALLTACFNNPKYYPGETTPELFAKKATIVSKMLSASGETIPGFSHILYDSLYARTVGGIHDCTRLEKALEVKRNEIATAGNYSSVDRAKLNTLDSLLHPNLGEPSSTPFKIYQLQKLLTEHPKNQDETFKEFMEIYGTIKDKGEELKSLLSTPPLSADTVKNLGFFMDMEKAIAATGEKFDLKPAFEAIATKNPAEFKQWFKDQQASLIRGGKDKEIAEALDATLHKSLGEVGRKILRLKRMVTIHNDELSSAVREFSDLYEEIKSEDLTGLYKAEAGLLTADAAENLKLFIGLMQNLPPTTVDVRDATRSLLVENFERLSQDAAAFVEGLVTNRREIAQDTAMNHEQKRELLSTIDLALNPTLAPRDSVELKMYQLQRMLAGECPDNKVVAFEEFMSIYREIPEGKLSAFFADLDQEEQNALVDLVNNGDVYVNSDTKCALLTSKDTSEAHRLALLEACFSNKAKYPTETNPKEKAAFVSIMLTVNNMFYDNKTLNYFRNHDLYWTLMANNKERDYTHLKDVIRKNIETARKVDPTAAKVFEDVLQTELQRELIVKFPCLQRREVQEKPTFSGLKDELALPDYKDLTDSSGFGFDSKSLDPQVRKYVTSLCDLRKCLDPVGSDLDNFIKTYNSIPEEDLEKVNASIDKKAAWKLVHESLGNRYNEYQPDFSKLRELDPKHRVQLLTLCFSLDNPADAHEKAKIVSNLIEMGDKLDTPQDKDFKNTRYYIYWAIAPGTGGVTGRTTSKPHYSLSELKNSLPKIAGTQEAVESDVVLEAKLPVKAV